jgi:hypothetical protein
MRRRFLSYCPKDEVVTSTGHECIFQQRVYGANGILQLDFLAFLVGSAVIGNTHLVEDAPSARELHGHLGLAAETLFTNIDRLDDLAPETMACGGSPVCAKSFMHKRN